MSNNLYRFEAKIISRSQGRSSVAAAAYRSGSTLHDQRTGITHDFASKENVACSAILAPDAAPEWIFDREKLWNTVEQKERRKDSQLAREVVVALPIDLPFEESRQLLDRFCVEQFVQRGMVADYGIHWVSGNPHAHVMLTTRDLNEAGFGQKQRDWNARGLLKEWREAWADHCNAVLEQIGIDDRLDHRSLKEQGIDRTPQIHLGWKAHQALQKGEWHPRLETYFAIESANAELAAATAALAEIQEEVAVEEAQLEADCCEVLEIAAEFYMVQVKSGKVVPREDRLSVARCRNYEVFCAPRDDGYASALWIEADDRGELARFDYTESHPVLQVGAGIEASDLQVFQQVQEAIQQTQQQWLEQIADVAMRILALEKVRKYRGNIYSFEFDRASRTLTIEEISSGDTFLKAAWDGENWIDRGSHLKQSHADLFIEKILPHVKAQEKQSQQQNVL